MLLFRRGGRRFLVRRSSCFVAGAITDVAGWEPIFEYQGTTLAEMDHEIKVVHSLPEMGDGADRHPIEWAVPSIQSPGQIPRVAVEYESAVASTS